MEWQSITTVLALFLFAAPSFSMIVITRSTLPCVQDTIANREAKASVIVSGYIDKIVRLPGKTIYKSEIKIVRVFKGAEEYLHNGDAVFPVMENDKITVGGFGDPNICYNMVQEGDTKILFMTVDSGGHLVLSSSLLTVTYNNLEVLDGAVNDLPVITKPPLEKGACDRVLCTFGAYCLEMEDTGKAKCVCPDSCAAEGLSAPVCGSDRVTYQSECHMKVTSCRDKQLLTVLNKGECVDPCEETTCGHGEVCRITPSNTASCECNEECEDTDAPVCGSNGKVYENECGLMAVVCKRKKNITVVYEGPCDPCKGENTVNGAVCRLNELRQAVLECTETCPEELSPVCGSDGVMYNSSCEMGHAACQLNMEIKEIPKEGCLEDGPCMQQPCEHGACQLSQNLEVTCVCPSECDAVYVPVCASDGVTYSSLCEMERKACLSKVELMVLYNRECEKDLDVCSKMECLFGSTCSDDSGVGMCECTVNCTSEPMDPVCGSDRVTYSSACEVERAICLQQTEIEIVSMGQCDLCEDFVCEHGSYCRMEEEGPSCRCAEFCNDNYSPVCGSDGVTYPNLCNLVRASCTESTKIAVASHGRCDQCENVNCTNGAQCKNGVCKCIGNCPFMYDPVCGTNGRTYESECKLKLYKCRRDPMLELAYGGECEEVEMETDGPSGYYGSGTESGDWSSGDDTTPYPSTSISMSEIQKCDESSCAYGGVCVPAGLGMRCSCAMSCPAIRSMVCGSDGETYGNECQMKEASCEQQRSIVKDECEDVEQDPCDGETPIVDDRSGEEYTCTEENRGDECPSGSYCHIHPMGNFAVCCPAYSFVENGNSIEQSLEREPRFVRKNTLSIEQEETITPAASLCDGSPYGCCPDGETPAEGPEEEGCDEEDCDCHDIGSYMDSCDSDGQCPCRPGVTGMLCNSCAPGYWNFKDILNGNEGCEPCDCNKAGSVRDDCGQNHGECVCKEGITGIKCEKCPAGQIMGSMGCENDDMTEAMTCVERECSFGAECVDFNDTSICKCPTDCPGTGEKVCGSDGQTYSTECQMKVIACRSEKDLYVDSAGQCETSIQEPTEPMAYCQMTEFGCCPDGENMAMGDNFEGCDGTTMEPYIIDGTQAPENQTMMSMACASSPCKRGGTCMNSTITPGFVCHCPLGTGGPVCMDSSHFSYPSFSGNSYIAYETISGFLKVSFTVEFKTTASEGLILYTGKSEAGTGDYIALVLYDKRVQLRFLLGRSQDVFVTSNVEIQPDVWYRVVANRIKRKGVISVDNEPKVSKQLHIGQSGLNLGMEMFVGDVAESREKVHRRVGVTSGFVGCIRSLEINNQVYNLEHPQEMGDMLYGANIGDCGTDPCLNSKCRNNATCIPGDGEAYTCECFGDFVGPYCADVLADQCEGNVCHFGSTCVAEPTGSYRCDCPPNVMGDRCEKGIEPVVSGPFVPSFGGKSYMEVVGLKANNQDRVEVEFLSTEENGIIFYQGQKTDGSGDFISLNLVDGFLEFRYDLGSGPAELRSSEKVALNEWLYIIVIRNQRNGSLEISGMEQIMGISEDLPMNQTDGSDPELPVGIEDPEGSMKYLNLGSNMFLGGVPSYSEISRKAAITDGLTGAIRKLILNGQELTDFNASSINQVNVEVFIPEFCRVDPCLPGLLCDGDTGDCVCPEGLEMEGDGCVAMEMSTETMSQSPSESMASKEAVDMATDGEMKMATDGEMKMATEGKMETATDKEAEGMVTATMPRETEPSEQVVPTEKMVQPDVTEPMVAMTTESEAMNMETEPEAVGMETDTPVVAPEKPMTDRPVTEGSKTSKLISAKMMMDMTTVTDMVDMEEDMTTAPMVPTTGLGGRVTSFPPPPPMTTTAPPRRTTGLDEDTMTTTMYPTTMASSTTRGSTAIPFTVDDPVSFTGAEYFGYNNLVTKVTKAQATNGGFTVSIRTEQEQGLVMWNGPVDFIGLAVTDGYVTFSYNLGAGTLLIKSGVYVSDGVWHTITASRYIREGSLSVDDEEPVIAEARAGASQLNTNGILYIGGAPDGDVPNGKLPVGFRTGFVGCIGFASVEEQQLHLFYDATGDQPEQFCPSSRR